jgi:hypothetical protein
LTFGPGLFQDGMFSPQTVFVFLVYEIARHIAIVIQQVIVDISQEHCLLMQQHVFIWYHPVIQSPLLPEACSWIKLHAGKIPVFF